MSNQLKYPAEVIRDGHPLFKALKWVSAARSNDETREILTYVRIEKVDFEQVGGVWNLVATDGRRLHRHEFDPGLFDDDMDLLEAGLYEVVAKGPKFIVVSEVDAEAHRYPDWRGVMPTPGDLSEVYLGQRTLSKLAIETGVLLAGDFLSDAIGFGHGRKKDDLVMVDFEKDADPDAPFYLRHDLGTAVVMPLKQSKGDVTDAEEGEPEPRDEKDQTPDFEAFADAFKAMKDALEPGGSVEITSGGKTVKIEGPAKEGGEDE